MKIIKGIILSFKKNPFFNSIDESVSIIEDGGILICDKSVVLAIPIGDFMPFQKGVAPKKYIKLSIKIN